MSAKDIKVAFNWFKNMVSYSGSVWGKTSSCRFSLCTYQCCCCSEVCSFLWIYIIELWCEDSSTCLISYHLHWQSISAALHVTQRWPWSCCAPVQHNLWISFVWFAGHFTIYSLYAQSKSVVLARCWNTETTTYGGLHQMRCLDHSDSF